LEDLKQYYELVEEGIRMANVKPEQCRSKTAGQWNLQRLKTDIWVDLWYMEEEGKTYFQVMTPLVEVPTENTQEFLQELLDLNYQLVSGAFVTYKNGVYVKITLDAETITPDLIFILLNRIGHYGKLFEEGLLERYKTKKLELND
jgi:hypothetical protein